MRATDLMRNILDLIDQIDNSQQEKTPAVAVLTTNDEFIQTGVDSNRFKQIFDILTSEYHQMYNNSPAEVVAGIDSVTTHAGGGWNGPKHPADMRSDSVSLYPNHTHKPE